MEYADEDLIEQYLKGNELSLKLLIDRYTVPIYNFIVRFAGATHTPDIVQEVFIKAWRNLKKFDISKAHFKTWLFTIARNATTDYLRKKKSITFSDLDEEDDLFSETLTNDDPLPDEVIDSLSDKKLLDNLISQLSPHYQSVLVLYYHEEMTFAQIGESLGKPLNTVKSHHRRALQQLRSMIESGMHQK